MLHQLIVNGEDNVDNLRVAEDPGAEEDFGVTLAELLLQRGLVLLGAIMDIIKTLLDQGWK